MSRHDTPFGDTVNPDLVSVTCDRCGDGFTTDEGTARRADLNGEQLWCDSCSNAGPNAPPELALDEPRVEDVRDDVGTEVGPDAKPPLEAALPATVGFGELAGRREVTVGLSRGTESLGTVTARPTGVDGQYLTVEVTPSLTLLTNDAREAIVSALSKRTQLLINVE